VLAFLLVDWLESTGAVEDVWTVGLLAGTAEAETVGGIGVGVA
jgi:hypothetical protein